MKNLTVLIAVLKRDFRDVAKDVEIAYAGYVESAKPAAALLIAAAVAKYLGF